MEIFDSAAVDSALVGQVAPSPVGSGFLPPKVRHDWPNVELEQSTGLGIVTRALGLDVSSVFQPIVTLDGTLYGEEALLRARSHGLKISPESVFRIAAAQGALVAFDRLARTLHLINFISGPAPRDRLHLNVHPRLLGEVAQHGVVFEEILHSVSWSLSQVTLEFQKGEASYGDFAQLHRAVNNYRRRGYGIALDDFGDYPLSQLDGLLSLAPDVVKLDWQQLSGSSASARKGLGTLVGLLHEQGAQVVVKGIETAAQRDAAIDLGADLLQGYFPGRPQPVVRR